MLDWKTALSQFLVGLGLPEAVAIGITLFVGALALAGVAPVLALVLIWITRKVISRVQDRIGPNRIGPYGLFQTVADALKLVSKETITPHNADLVVYALAPILSVFGVIMAVAVIPFANGLIGADLNVGVLYVVALGSVGIMAALMAGWSSNNKYALLGAFRAVAMLVSYEVPIILTLLVPVMLSGTLNVNAIVEQQSVWYFFMAPLAGIIFYIGSHAEAARAPFDMLEAESEIVAGYQTEYGGMAFAMFYLAEFLHAFTISALAAIFFFGGWRGPFALQVPTLGIVYFFIKTFAIYLFNVWVRGTLPRLRIDQVMSFCWKFLVPLTLVLLVGMILVDKIAQTFIPGYAVAGGFVDLLPRTAALLIVNVVVGLLALGMVVRQGRRERERLAAAEVAPIERPAASVAK